MLIGHGTLVMMTEPRRVLRDGALCALRALHNTLPGACAGGFIAKPSRMWLASGRNSIARFPTRRLAQGGGPGKGCNRPGPPVA